MARMTQIALYACFAAVLGYLSVLPRFEYADPTLASIKLSLSHAADRIAECVRLSPDQIAQRAASGEGLPRCERERRSLLVELEIDGSIAFRELASPTGLWNDGPASVYSRIEIEPGTHAITARLRDSAREEGWDFTHTEIVDLVAGRYFTISFREEAGGFGFR